MIVTVLLSDGGGTDSLESICAGGGGAKIVQSGYHAGVFCMVILTLFCIHKYNVIDGIARRKFKERYQFQFYENITNKYVIG